MPCSKLTGRRMIYAEGNWWAEVIVVADDSNDEWESYTLQVVRTIEEDENFTPPAPNMVFSVKKTRFVEGVATWHLFE